MPRSHDFRGEPVQRAWGVWGAGMKRSAFPEAALSAQRPGPSRCPSGHSTQPEALAFASGRAVYSETASRSICSLFGCIQPTPP
jgi:hypothetical protein